MRVPSGALVCGIIDAWGSHDTVTPISMIQIVSIHYKIPPGASSFPSVALFTSSDLGLSVSRGRLDPLTRLSELCLSGERVRTVTVSRVTREVRSVRLSSVDVPDICLRDEVEVLRSVAAEPERW